MCIESLREADLKFVPCSLATFLADHATEVTMAFETADYFNAAYSTTLYSWKLVELLCWRYFIKPNCRQLIYHLSHISNFKGSCSPIYLKDTTRSAHFLDDRFNVFDKHLDLQRCRYRDCWQRLLLLRFFGLGLQYNGNSFHKLFLHIHLVHLISSQRTLLYTFNET